eukprot:TRINITY_DN10404_c0_g1_i1.p1 TRINITY_DN10404_c0_g1~~TRINITY_DN10404_c0_g1_i1.p1  ORF type:complete len:493 (+),score=42.54 TRINITY_DN10404_c0_g1_i1:82-1560(+)
MSMQTQKAESSWSECPKKSGYSPLTFVPVEREPSEDLVEFKSLKEMVVPFFLPRSLTCLASRLWVTVLPLQLLQNGCSLAWIGTFGLIGGMGSIVICIPYGKYVGRFGPRVGMMTSSCMFFIAAVVAGVPSWILDRSGAGQDSLKDPSGMTWLHFVVFGCYYFLVMAADNAMILSAQVLVSATVEKSIIGQFSSTNGGMNRLCFLLAPGLSGYVATTWNPHWVFIMQGVIALIAVPTIFVCMPGVDAQQHAKADTSETAEGKSEEISSISSVLCEHFGILSRISFIAGLLMFGRNARDLLFPMLGHALGLTHAYVGSMASVSYAVDLAMSPLAGYMMDNVGRRTPTVASLSLGAASLCVSSWCSMQSYHAYALLSGIACGSAAGVITAFAADSAPAECRSTFLSLYRTSFKTADALAPFMIGSAAAIFSLQVAQLATAGMCMLGVFVVPWCISDPSRSSNARIGEGRHELPCSRFELELLNTKKMGSSSRSA